LGLRSKLRKAATAVGGLSILGVVGFRTLGFSPDAVEPLEPESRGEVRTLSVGDTFTVLVWNLQFSGSRDLHFFYDGGDSVSVPDSLQETTLRKISSVIGEANPDLVLLQEVDRNSDRTGNIDQLARLITEGDWSEWVTTPYFKSRYVPHPPGNHMGRVEMDLVILSRFGLEAGERIQLPLLRESWLRQQFNLKRALQWVSLPIEGGDSIRIGNTHLSAFSHGDGTLGHQAGVLSGWMGSDENWLLGGDFNMLPPSDDPARLGEEGLSTYADSDNPIAILDPTNRDVSRDDLASEEWRTYLSFGSSQPDRRLDYLFVGDRLEVVDARVMSEHSDISDHLPIIATLRVR